MDHVESKRKCIIRFFSSKTKQKDLFVERFVVFEKRLEGLEDFDFGRNAGAVGRLSFDHRHPQRPFVARHQTLQVFQQQLQSKK